MSTKTKEHYRNFPDVSDAEIIALAAVANCEAVQMAGENKSCEINGHGPAYCATGTGMMEAGEKLRDELFKRGVLK